MNNLTALKTLAAKILGVDADTIPGKTNAEVIEYIANGYTGESGSAIETDPTVPGWAKQPEKPTYTAAEVGAFPDTTVIPAGAQLLQGERSGSIQQLAEDADTAAVIETMNQALAALRARGVIESE